MNFGEELRKIRKENGLSIRKTGELTGISHAYLSQIENGKRPKPKPDIIKKLSKALNVNYVDLMEKAGYFEDLPQVEKERLSVNIDYQFHLGEMLDDALNVISLGESFIPEVIEYIKVIEQRFDNQFEENEPLNPVFIRKLVAEADWQQEWIWDLVSDLVLVSRNYVNKKNQVTELITFLKLPGITYKDKPLSEDSRKQISDMLNVLFPEK